MKCFTVDDAEDALKHEVGKFKEPHDSVFDVTPRLVSKRHPGIYTESRPVLRPPDVTRFQTLITDLKETSYESYWKKDLGKSRDPTAGLPAGTEPLSVTFGKPLEKGPTMKQLINPPQTVYEVLWDSQIGHEMYKKTHNDYNPAERICRDYLKPPYDADRRYGIRGKYDLRGVLARCACNWHNNEPTTVVNNIQADALKNKPHLGKSATPNDIAQVVPKNHTFGKPFSPDFYGMEDLMKDADCEPCLLKRDFHDWMQALNALRNILKKRDSTHFSLKEFYEKILHYDYETTGWLPKEVVYKLCECNAVNFEHEKLEPLFEMLGILKEGHIHYRSFVNLLDVNQPTLEMRKIEDVPTKNLCYITSSMAANCDFLYVNNADRAPAGIPTKRLDLPRVNVPHGRCFADRDNLGDKTSAAVLVNPSIYTNYGLSHRDFCMPRQPEFIRKLFANIGCEFSDNKFQELWQKGVEVDKTGLVCINTFKNLIQ